MLTILTPSKTMDFSTQIPIAITPTTPVFDAEARQIRQLLASYPHTEMAGLMRTSTTLTNQVMAMYQSGDRKSALWTYHGDVFKGVQAASLGLADVEWAQQHLLIPSAVYGLLRPLDVISPYRLEMSAVLAVGDSHHLYDFWATRLANYVQGRPELSSVLCVLASKEYARAVLAQLPHSIRVVTPVFMDRKSNGTLGQVPIYSKMMRGVMARWLIDQRIDQPDRLMEFSAHGYQYDPSRSTPDQPVFCRQVMTPLVFN